MSFLSLYFFASLMMVLPLSNPADNNGDNRFNNRSASQDISQSCVLIQNGCRTFCFENSMTGQIVILQRERCRDRDGRCVLTLQQPLQRKGHRQWTGLEAAHIIGRGCYGYVISHTSFPHVLLIEFQGFRSIHHGSLYSRILSWST